jgi:hypothetical protein
MSSSSGFADYFLWPSPIRNESPGIRMLFWCDSSKWSRSIASPQTTHDKSDVHSCLQRGSNPISHCSDGNKTALTLQGNNTVIGNNQTWGVGAIYKLVSERTHQAYFAMEQLFSYIDIFNIITAVLFSFCAEICYRFSKP